MVIVNGENLDEPNANHFGPVCYDDPEALYYYIGNFGLVSSFKAMYIVFYSLVGFEGTPWDPSGFKLEFMLTKCRGFWNPCPSATTYVNLSRMLPHHIFYECYVV